MTETKNEYADKEKYFIHIDLFHPCIGETFKLIPWNGSWERVIHDIREFFMVKYGYNFNIDLLEIKLNQRQWESFKKEMTAYLKYYVNPEINKKSYNDEIYSFMEIKISEKKNNLNKNHSY